MKYENFKEYVEEEVHKLQNENERFQVTDESSANWALRKIKETKEEIKHKSELAEKEIYKWEAWLKEEEDKLQQSIDYFQSLLGEYALKERENNPKFKSMKLPEGTFRFKKQQPKFNYDDEKLLKYLKESGETDLINVKETPNKSAVKKLFNVNGDKLINVGTGEIVEGVTIEEREDKFEVIVDE